MEALYGVSDLLQKRYACLAQDNDGKIHLFRICFVGLRRIHVQGKNGDSLWFTREGTSINEKTRLQIIVPDEQAIKAYYTAERGTETSETTENTKQKAHDAATFCQQRTREELLELIPERLLVKIYEYNREEIEKDKVAENNAT